MIPKSFKLVNRTYRVIPYPEGLADDLKRLGDCERNSGCIRLDTATNPENLEHTFYHELAHALLYTTTKPKLSDNEDFVDSLGAALHQFMQTRKGEF